MSTISVIMSVYNEEKYVHEAINSILQQTFSDWEMIIIDDGSNDRTLEIIKNFQDNRITIIQNSRNEGLIYNLNMGLKLAKSKYIARMDGDDICIATRFEKQVKYLDENNEINLVGSYVKTFGDKESTWRPCDNHEYLKVSMLFRPVLAHPSIMMRKDLIERCNMSYSDEYKCAEDYDLVSRVSECGRIGVVEEVLLLYRIHKSQVTFKGNVIQSNSADKVRQRLLYNLGLNLSESDYKIYMKWALETVDISLKDLKKGMILIEKFVEANKKSEIYEENSLDIYLLRLFFQWVVSCKKMKIYLYIPRLCDFRWKNFHIVYKEIIRRVK